MMPLGIDEQSTIHMFIELGALLTILHTEVFRTLLLFHSKGFAPETAFGKLLYQLRAPDAAPNAIRRLEPYLDLDFRNALAHGLFGTKGKQIVLYKNAKLEVWGILDLADFMIRSKNQNVLTQCMTSVIVQKKKAGFFTPASL